MSQGHTETNRAAVVLHEQCIAIQMQLLCEVLHDLRQMIKGVSEGFRIRPGGVSKAGIVRSDEMVVAGQVRLQQRLIHPGRRGQPVEKQNRRSIFWSGLSIENIKIVDPDCAVENFTESICEVHDEDDSNWD